MGPIEGMAERVERQVHCKQYHRPKRAGTPVRLRTKRQSKSECPAWAMDARLQNALITDALEDSGGAA